MLFILAMEALNALIEKADATGLLQNLNQRAIHSRASFYADDVVVFLSHCQMDLTVFKDILRLFGEASGLHSNIEKCQVTHMRCDQDHKDLVQQIFPCQTAEFPCKYLGVLLHYRKLCKHDVQPIVDAVGSCIPIWKGGLLSKAGCLILTKVTLSSMSTHVAIAVALPAWAIRAIDKKRRAFLWKGTDMVRGGHCPITWDRVCSPKTYGGLSLPNLTFFGYALRLRWEWMRRVQPTKC
jgi:hypothetical protein